MENFKIVTYSLCAAMFVSAVFRLIVSGSKLEKSVNIFLSVFVFMYCIIPFNNFNFDIESYFDMEESNTDTIYHSGYERIVIESIEKICDEKNVRLNSIDVDSYIDENGDYIVNKIVVESETEDNKEYIQSIIKNELGFEVEVV